MGLVSVCECACGCLCLQTEVMRTCCWLWPPLPCGGGFFQGFPPNAKFIRSRRLILSPVGSPGECQISRESVYKLKAGVPLITQRSLLHPVYWISNAGAKTKNANMTLLANTPTLEIHRGLRWKEQDHHQLLRLRVNHGMVVNKWTVMDLVFTALLCGLLFEACR